ncbi:MAG: hypothetical protein WDA18_04560 [Candidatus Ratteibacteria bacterium]
MDRQAQRYRIRGRPYLCLNATEALSTGISTREETLEKLILNSNSGSGFFEYAVVSSIPEETLLTMAPHERKERTFYSRREAFHYLRTLSKEFSVYGIAKTEMLDPTLVDLEEQDFGNIMDELKAFEKKPNPSDSSLGSSEI